MIVTTSTIMTSRDAMNLYNMLMVAQALERLTEEKP